jgi:hypothetical protein
MACCMVAIRLQVKDAAVGLLCWHHEPQACLKIGAGRGVLLDAEGVWVHEDQLEFPKSGGMVDAERTPLQAAAGRRKWHMFRSANTIFS